ncbi:MAG: ABC transporter substrate-binding protein [Burkholderiales bacterium]|nr:ABC transporter substrate-binding protein [Burkholderiales bacterium]
MFRTSTFRIGAILLALFASALASAVKPSAEAAASAEAASVVEGFQKTLISVMRDASKLGYEGRYQRLDPAIKNSHDLAGITRIAAGRNWEKLSEQQKARLIELFTKLSISTYAARFDGYSGETFKTIAEEKLGNGDALVRTVFTDSTGDTIPFDYVLRQQDGQWQIVNITVEGVSDLAIRRSEYASIIQREGIEGLFKQLQDKIADYRRLAEAK